MSSNSNGGEGGAALVFFLIIAAVIIAVAIASIAVGAFYGGGKAAYNYGIAFQNNVALEKPQPAA